MGRAARHLVALALVGGAGCSAISGLGGLDFDGDGSGGAGASGGSGGSGAHGPASSSNTASSTGASGASCNDGEKNQDETDVDCGGSCAPCALGASCKITGDCAAGGCVEGFCQTPPVGVWLPIQVAFSPQERFGCSMFWDGSQIRMLHGKHADGSFGGALTNLWNGTAWSSIATQPSGLKSRYWAATATSATELFLFGGDDDGSQPLYDTWTFAVGAPSWQSGGGQSPLPRYLASMAASPASALLFGGTSSGSFAEHDTYAFDTSWRRLHPAHDPPARFAAAMAYDVARDRTLLFGGRDTSTSFDDFWIWDGTDWAPGLTGPAQRFGAAMVYATPRARTVLFTGTSSGTVITPDTWEWDGATWVETSTSAPAVHDACAAYDPSRRRIVLFGGEDAVGTITGQTYEYHVHGDACRKDTDCDTGHCVDNLCCEQAACDTCARCNDPTAPGVCTTCDACEAGACK